MTMTNIDERLARQFAFAQKLLHKAQAMAPSDFGVTIIVHDADPGTAADSLVRKAVASTLRDRSQVRGMLADCLVQSTMADGITDGEAVRKTAQADFARLYGREPPEET